MSPRGPRHRPQWSRGAPSGATGRVTRASAAAPLPHVPTLPGEPGAVAKLVHAVAERREGIEGAGNRARKARARAVALVGREAASDIEVKATAALAVVPKLGAEHDEVRRYLDDAAKAAVHSMREVDASTTTGRTAIATGHVLRGLGHALLAKGARTLDADELRAAAMLIDAGRRELLFGFEVERRAVIERDEPSTLDLLLADHAPDPGTDPPSADEREDNPATDGGTGHA